MRATAGSLTLHIMKFTPVAIQKSVSWRKNFDTGGSVIYLRLKTSEFGICTTRAALTAHPLETRQYRLMENWKYHRLTLGQA